MNQSLWKSHWVIVISATLYFAFAWFVIESNKSSVFASIWFANAIGVLCLALLQKSRWLLGLTAIGGANLLANIQGGNALNISLAFLPGNLLEMGLGALILAKYFKFDSCYSSNKGFLVAFSKIIIPPCLIGALMGACVLVQHIDLSFREAFLTWFIGDITGQISLLPFGLAAIRRHLAWGSKSSTSPSVDQIYPEPAISERKFWLENQFVWVATGLLVLTYYAVYGTYSPFIWITMNCVVVAVTYNFLQTAFFAALMSILVGWQLGQGLFPFSKIIPTADIHFFRLSLATGLFIPLYLAINKRVLHGYSFRLEEALTNANQAAQAKNLFLATMSHEIRTPLNAIVGTAYLLEKTPLSDPQKTDLKTIRYASQTLLGLINDILDLSKIEAGEMHIETHPFSLATLLEELNVVFSSGAAEKGLKLDFAPLAADFPIVLDGDSNRLRQILINLVTNAIKFTEQGEIRLKVTARPQDNEPGNLWLRFEIADTGIGIREENLEFLFQPFTQADSSITRCYGGTGLGLSIVKHLTRLMGGEVGVQSTLGHGSTFWVELPMQVAQATCPATSDAPASSNRFSKAAPDRSALVDSDLVPDQGILQIMVVDDSQMNLDVCRRILVDAGANPILCLSGAEAMAILSAPTSQSVDLVLLDLHMPDMTGYQLAEWIRQQPGLKNLPILALTAGVTSYERSQALEAGMNDFLSKPISPPLLIRKIRQALEQSGEHLTKALPRSSEPMEQPVQTGLPAPDWPMEPELDGERASLLLGGDLAFFATILEGFIDEHHETPEKIKALINQQAMQGAAHLAHRLKGQAGNLGANLLFTAAGNLEKAIIASSSCPSTLILELETAHTRCLTTARQWLNDYKQRSSAGNSLEIGTDH